MPHNKDAMGVSGPTESWPWCDACQSWHHPENPTCKLKGWVPRDAEATIDALLAGHEPLLALLAGVTKERDELKITLRAARKAVNEGADTETLLSVLSLKQLAGHPHR
jgi:hypothetical protein